MTYWNARALRFAAIACAALAASLIAPPADAQQVQNRRFRTAPEADPKPVDRFFFNYNYFSAVVEGGGTFSSFNGGVSGTFGPTPPGGSASTDGSFLGGDFQIPLTIFFGQPGAAAPRLPFTPIFGASARGNFSNSGTIPFHIHTPANPTLLTFARDSSATFYGGVRVAVGDLLGNGTNVVITPRMGVNVEQGKLTLVTDERGPVTRISQSKTGTGFHGGVDVDFFLPFSPTFSGGTRVVSPFVGFGVAVDTVPNVSLAGQSALFHYRATADQDVNVTVKGRLGIAFGAR